MSLLLLLATVQRKMLYFLFHYLTALLLYDLQILILNTEYNKVINYYVLLWIIYMEEHKVIKISFVIYKMSDVYIYCINK